MWLNSWQARPTVGRVDDRQVLLHVLREEAVEEGRVAVLERRQPDVLLEGVLLALEVLVLEGQLLLDRQDPIRQQAVEAERPALIEREGKILGQEPAVQELAAGDVDLGRQSGSESIEGRWQRPHPGSIARRSSRHPCPTASRRGTMGPRPRELWQAG